MDFEKYMKMALSLAREASEHREVPVGCVVADEAGAVIGTGRNRCVERGNQLAHAEMEAIASAARSRGDWRLDGCTLFVTLEPCPMCAGAIINSRVSTLVYGAREERTGSCASVINLFEERYPSRPAIYAGVLANECAAVLRDFFSALR